MARWASTAGSVISAAPCSILLGMSKRLQIVVDQAEAEGFERSARKEGLTLSEWARRAMREEQRRRRAPTAESKLRALDRALQHNYPTGDIGQMLAEIEAGRDLR
jgi:hypothetical protein